MRTALAIVTAASLLGLPITEAAANGSQAPRKVTSTRKGKPAAPVDITATLEADRAQIEVTFLTAATSVDVRVHGVSGLALTGPATTITGSFAKGESAKTMVTFTPPAGQANLVVTVRGVFNGSRSAKTATFTIGQPTSAEAQKASAGVKVEPNGERVKELPGERR